MYVRHATRIIIDWDHWPDINDDFGHVYIHVYRDLCTDIHIDMCTDMCTDIHIAMHIDMCTDMCMDHVGHVSCTVVKVNCEGVRCHGQHITAVRPSQGNLDYWNVENQRLIMNG